MKTRYLLLFFVLFSIVTPSNGQVKIEGTVRSNSGEEVSNVHILFCDITTNGIIKYTKSNDNGYFAISLNIKADSILLKTSHLSYEEKSIIIPNTSALIDLTLQSRAEPLLGAIIKPNIVERRGDTLNFFVSGFISPEDRNIGDVIKKLPGLEITSSGQINYMGLSINQFTVEEMDLMGGRYGGIVNNLSINHVSVIQILENYEPIRAKQHESMSERAGINLKLKESAKNSYLGYISTSLGYKPLIFDNEGSLMQFASKKQMNLIYKGNNSGKRLDNELISFYGSNSDVSVEALTSVRNINPPISNTERYLENQTHSLNLNRLYKTGQYSTIRLQGDIIYADESYRSSIENSYFISNDSTLTILENNRGKTDRINTDLSVEYILNDPSAYVRNASVFKGSWRNNEFSLSNTLSGKQHNNIDYLVTANSFSLTKIAKRINYEIKSDFIYSSGNEEFIVLNGVDNYNYDQQISKKSLLTNNFISVKNKQQLLHYDITAGFLYRSSRLFSELSIEKTTSDSLTNNIKGDIFKIYLNPSFSLRYKKFYSLLSLPLSYDIKNKKNSGDPFHNTGIYVDPNLSVRYEPYRGLNFTLRAYREHKISDDPISLHEGYILTNYRTMNRSMQPWRVDTLTSISLSARLSSTENMLTINGTVGYSNRKSNTIISQYFEEIMMYREFIEAPVTTESLNSSLGINKSFYGWIRKIGLLGLYSLVENSQIQSLALHKNKYSLLTLNLSINTRVSSITTLDYSARWSNIKTIDDNGVSALGSINIFSHNVDLSTNITKEIMLSINGEQQISLRGNVPSSFFIDVNIGYKRTKVEYMVSCSNILNTKQYITESLSSFLRTKSTYPLNGRRIKFSLIVNF